MELFVSEEALFAGVGIEAGNGNAPAHPEPLQGVVRQPDRRQHPLLGDPVAGLSHRQVGGDVGDAHIAVHQHHRHPGIAAHHRQHLRMPRIGHAR